MRTFEFHKPRVVNNVRDEVEPLMKEYREAYFKDVRDFKAGENNETVFLPHGLVTLAIWSAIKLHPDDEVEDPRIEYSPRIGEPFMGVAKFWHVRTEPMPNLRMIFTSTPPKIAAGTISFDDSLAEEAERRSNPLYVGADSVLTSLFKIVSERAQNQSDVTWRPSSKSLDWIDVASRGELGDSRYHLLDGLVVVEDLEHFVPEDFDVFEAPVDTLLHAASPRKAGEPTIQAFGRAHF